MPKVARELSALAVSKIRTPGLHMVGGVPGLGLQVLPSGTRTWIVRLTVGGKRRDMGLGGFPEVTLATARDRARDARDLVRRGIDPIEAGRAARSALKAQAQAMVTFKEAAEAFIASQESSWRNPKHRAQWRSTLETYAYPVIGSLSVADVELPHVLKILEGIWNEKTETATRLRGRIEAVLDWATVRKYRTGENPARWRGHLDKVLPKPSKVAKVEHHAALPIDQMGGFMAQLRAAKGAGARALEFAILTAARSGEVRGATWDEIDLDAAIWTIPAGRMKAGKEHRVPLSTEAVDLLKKLPRVAGEPHLFSAGRGPLSDATLLAVLKRMGVGAVPHGFRSTFRDWVSERTAYPGDMGEMALAHAIGSKVEAAYRRGDMFEKRRRMMADWARFCSAPAPQSGAAIRPIREAVA